MKLASMANYQQAGIIAVEYDTDTETGSAYTIIDGVVEELPGGPVQHNAAGHLATEANYGGDLVSAQYDATSGSGAASAVVGGEDIVIVGEAGNGIIAISTSPDYNTTPTLASILPIESYDPEADDIVLNTETQIHQNDQFTFTVTPSSEYVAGITNGDSDEVYGQVGEPVSATFTASLNNTTGMIFVNAYDPDDLTTPVAGAVIHIDSN